jgi:ABC-type multidrug transport system ATPase subunit/pSer/pThr/pTyr-binding forkhead associated (FHA) protein
METNFFQFEVVLPGGGSRKKLQKGQTIHVGRSSSAQIVLEHPSISRLHLKLDYSDRGVFVTDCGSSNGTMLGNRRLVEQVPVQWTQGELYLGNGAAVLRWMGFEQGRARSEQAGGGLRRWMEGKSEVVIGRSSQCDCVLEDVMVSRKHARVYAVGHEVWVEDLHSTNGTFINGKRITGKHKLRGEDSLSIGAHVFHLDRENVAQSEYAIVAEGISKVFANGVKGLQHTTIKLPSKKFIALMGPSGCGKSTLLKALNGDSPPSSGQVTIFNQDMRSNFESIKHIIGYVPQENIVHEALTVEQALYYASKIRLPEDTSDEEIETRIGEVLKVLKIDSPQLRSNAISKLSGGQKKRVCIAVELLTKPKVLFLDEPTSPLDPETIEEFLNCIRALCEQGTTVVMVTHKPEDLTYVDRVVFMGVNGHLSYDGGKEGLLSHFRKENIIQLYSLLSDKQQAANWHSKWFQNQSVTVDTFPNIEVQRSRSNPVKQFYWLAARYFQIKLANPVNMLLMLVQPLFIAGLVIISYPELVKQAVDSQGSASEEAQIPVLFLTAIAAIWFGVSNSAKEIVGEWDIAQREFRVNVRLMTYLLSKFVVLTIISALQIAIFLILLNIYYSELNNMGQMFLVLCVVGAAAIQFGLLLSVFSRSVEVVMSLLPLALMPQIILAGFLSPLSQNLGAALSAITLGRWSTEMLTRIQDEHLPNPIFTNAMEFMLYPRELDILKNGTLTGNFLAMLLLLVVMHVIVVIKLNQKIRPNF